MAKRAKANGSVKQSSVDQAATLEAEKASDPDPQQPSESAPKLSPEARAKLYEIRGRLESAVGQIVLLMMQSPAYRHVSLADLNNLVVEPLLRDRLSIARARGESEAEGQQTVIGAALWATVEEDADKKIKEQVRTGVFPVRLTPDELTSGDTLWLLDIVARDRKAATAVLLNFKGVAGDRPIRLHPMVARKVDPEVLKKLKFGGSET